MISRNRDSHIDAETIAIQALGHIAGDEDLVMRFLALTGCGPADVRARAAEPAFLGAVLDFVLGDERLVVAFAQAHDLPPEAVMAARRALPGWSGDW